MGIKLKGLNLGYMGLDYELMVFPHPNYALTAPRQQGAMTDLINGDALVRGVDLGQSAVVHHDAVRGGDGRQIAGTVVEDSNLQHISLLMMTVGSLRALLLMAQGEGGHGHAPFSGGAHLLSGDVGAPYGR
jgi:hypothetical protein